MNYEEFFEDLRAKASAEASAQDAATKKGQDDLFLLLGRDPDMRAFPIEGLKKSIAEMDGFISICNNNPGAIPPSVVEVMTTMSEVLKSCAMAIWFKEQTLARIAEKLIDDPVKAGKDFKRFRDSYKGKE